MEEGRIRESNRRIQMMGTTIDLKVAHETPEMLIEGMVDLLTMYNQRFSANDPLSELNMINDAAGTHAVKVSPDLYELIALGKIHSCGKDSHLNIAIGPLVQKWRIGFEDTQMLTETQVSPLLQLTDPHQILLEAPSFVKLERVGMNIDLGALAKGFIADALRDYCQIHHAHYALINLGGNIVTYGASPLHDDGCWRIGIRDPKGDREATLLVLPIHDQSVVTSGIYERYETFENKLYHHIFDPTTGFPVESSYASITIVAKDSLLGEIWTTRLFGLSIEEVCQQIDEHPEIEGILVTHDNQVIVTDGIKQLVSSRKG